MYYGRTGNSEKRYTRYTTWREAERTVRDVCVRAGRVQGKPARPTDGAATRDIENAFMNACAAFSDRIHPWRVGIG